MNQNSVVDVFELVMNGTEDTKDGAFVEEMSVDEAFVKSLDAFGDVDIEYIAATSGKSVEEVSDMLKGSIFQDPETFGEHAEYRIEDGWVVSSNYLSGNIKRKLEKAIKANRKYGGRFESNIDALKKALPFDIEIEDIHLSLGATWVPESEYVEFITDFLRLREPIDVIFYKDLSKWKIIRTDESQTSVLNTITYGVKAETTGAGWTRQYLTALDIIEQTMNSKTIKVYDYIPKRGYSWSNFEYEAVLNRDKTLEAQERQKEIMDAFKDWVYKTKSRTDRFEEYYNEAFVGYAFQPYDGSFLQLPDLNPDVELYDYQRNAVARILLSKGNVVLAHDVGTGKTYEIIVSARELHRMGISKKNLIVVPNNVLKATVDMHKKLYKDDKILAVYPSDFTPQKRDDVLAQIKYGDYVAIYIAYSSFDMIAMSKQHYTEKIENQIKKLKAASFNTNLKHEKKALESQAKRLQKRLSKHILETKECEWASYEELGIQTLIVDEAHNYKNIPIETRASGIVGMGGAGGSKKCREMLEKVHATERVIFATGTPLTNSLADLYAFQKYLQPEVLEYHNVSTFDTWINTFGQRETTIECDVDANSLRTMTRFSSFHNLGELMSLFSQVCDFHHLDENSKELPTFNGYIDVSVPKNEAQKDYIKNLSERTEKIRNKEVKRTEDNMLKVTIDGRNVGLDERLVDETAILVRRTDNKISVCSNNVTKQREANPDSVQIVFCDIGTPKEKFNVYDELTRNLLENGFKRNEIAYIHDATTDSARAKLFEAMNKGILKVVIGSTQKLGVGVNVQERLVAIHHLSVPWRPADMVQREGRILRKGNTSKEIFIYRYITEGSFDAYLWQLLENKQRFIASFLSGTAHTREITDIADTVLSYAEVKALAIGNPLIKKRVEVANILDRTKIASRGRQKQLQELRSVIENMPQRVKNLKKLAYIAKCDYQQYVLSKEKIPNEERIAFGEELISALNGNVMNDSERVFDVYQSFTIVLPSYMKVDNRHVIIKSNNGGSYMCEIDEEKTPMGCSKALDYLLDHLDERSDMLVHSAENAQKQINEAKEELDKGNPYIQEIDSLKEELSMIDMEIEKASKNEVA